MAKDVKCFGSSSRFPHKWIEQDDVWAALWRGGVAEFFATMIFIFIGCGSVISSQAVLGDGGIGVPNITLISLAHGFCIMVLVYSVGEVSGGHINPAVTWAALITGKVSFLRALVYWISQLLGGVVGAAFLMSVHPTNLIFGLGCHGLNSNLTPAQGFFIEIILTFIFIFVVFATAISPFVGKVAPLAGQTGPGKLTPFAVGMTILILHTVGIPMTGASMNPARSFGPAVVHGGACWNNHWIYWLGPIIGSTIAAAVSHSIFLMHPATLYGIFSRRYANLEVPQSENAPGAPGYKNVEEGKRGNVPMEDL